LPRLPWGKLVDAFKTGSAWRRPPFGGRQAASSRPRVMPSRTAPGLGSNGEGRVRRPTVPGPFGCSTALPPAVPWALVETAQAPSDRRYSPQTGSAAGHFPHVPREKSRDRFVHHSPKNENPCPRTPRRALGPGNRKTPRPRFPPHTAKPGGTTPRLRSSLPDSSLEGAEPGRPIAVRATGFGGPTGPIG